MSKRRSYSSYSSYYNRERERRFPSPLPYFIVALLAAAGLGYFHFFAFQSVQGKVTNAYSGAPMPGVVLTIQSSPPTPGATPHGAASRPLTATTDTKGTYAIDKLPPDPMLSVTVDGFAPQQVPIEGKRTLDIQLVPNVLRGTVFGVGGKPVAGASVWAGTVRTQTGPDGTYTLKNIPAERKLVVKSPGYLASTVQFGQVVTQDITLQPFIAKAIYLNADTVATPGKLQALMDLIDKSELTAVVIDVKADNSGMVLYDSKVPQVLELGMVSQIIPDLNGLLAALKAKNIYTIARLSVFWDQALTAKKPEWALKSKKAPGQVWVGAGGKRWSNPYVGEVWDYNIAIAKEVAERGFDEIQFDNVQFPDSGELDDIDFGPTQAGRKRAEAIAGFLNQANKVLAPMGKYISCNVLGLTALVQDDMGVGQHFEDIAGQVDYISPFIYPYSFGDGFLGFPKAVEHPAEIVAATMRAGMGRLGNSGARIRPWLQDFSVKVKYDAPQVRAEIDSAEQNSAVGWMLWNFGNEYTAGALK